MLKPAGFKATFKTLRALLKPYEHHFVVAYKPEKYYLATKTSHPAHVKELTAITKQGFAGFVNKFP